MIIGSTRGRVTLQIVDGRIAIFYGEWIDSLGFELAMEDIYWKSVNGKLEKVSHKEKSELLKILKIDFDEKEWTLITDKE